MDYINEVNKQILNIYNKYFTCNHNILEKQEKVDLKKKDCLNIMKTFDECALYNNYEDCSDLFQKLNNCIKNI